MNMKVSDLFCQGSNEWDEEKIRNMFLQLEAKSKAIKPSLMGAPDNECG
ncbi:hypothetical protein HID58_003336 [Brassica napus]|uniref:Uncharacterized protein n=1 Tax=Brassica napus TaxID=3708 RepID=A0ABQ8EPT4_BRANA|nr:hypothetical protein HID58_003336 [Brassica napus]